MNIIPFPAARPVPGPVNTAPLAAVLAQLHPELQNMHPMPGESLPDYHARRDAALDILDDLLADYDAEDELVLDGAA